MKGYLTTILGPGDEPDRKAPRPKGLPPRGETARQRGRKLTTEERSKISRAVAGKFCRTPEYRAKMSATIKAKWADPEFKRITSAKISKGRREKFAERQRLRDSGERYF